MNSIEFTQLQDYRSIQDRLQGAREALAAYETALGNVAEELQGCDELEKLTDDDDPSTLRLISDSRQHLRDRHGKLKERIEGSKRLIAQYSRTLKEFDIDKLTRSETKVRLAANLRARLRSLF